MKYYRGAPPAEMTVGGGTAIGIGAAAQKKMKDMKKESSFRDAFVYGGMKKLGFWGTWGKKAKSASN